MSQLPSPSPILNEAALARECLRSLSEPTSILYRAAHALELVAHSSIGLGEVLQDFAHQSTAQLQEIIRAAHNASQGPLTNEDAEILSNLHLIMKSAKTVLDMTPVAMNRNKAEAVGEKEKLTRVELAQIADEFSQSPEIMQLLASEDSGHRLVVLLSGAAPENLQPGREPALAPMPAVVRH